MTAWFMWFEKPYEGFEVELYEGESWEDVRLSQNTIHDIAEGKAICKVRIMHPYRLAELRDARVFYYNEKGKLRWRGDDQRDPGEQ